MLVGLGIIILLPLLGPLFVAIGALYGLAREIIESDKTNAESIFDWYSRRFFSLAGAGFAMFIVIFSPIWSIWMTGYALLDGVIIGTNTDILIGLSLLWGLLAAGFLSLTFPAVIDGNSALLSIGISMSMVKKNPSRVFTVWLTYFVMIVGLLAPLIWPRYYIRLSPIPYPVLAVLLIVFLIIPAMAISQSRIYLLLSGEDDQVLVDESQQDLPDTTLSGGM
jgi:hypothetical protein